MVILIYNIINLHLISYIFSDHQSGSETDTSNSNNVVKHESESMTPTNNVSIPGYRRVKAPSPSQSARYEDTPDGKEIQYKGYTNPDLQSKTFKTLQNMVETGQGSLDYYNVHPLL